MNATTATAHRPPHAQRHIPWRRVAGVTAGVLAIGGMGALVHDVAEPSSRPAVVAAPSASSVPADASAIWSALLRLDASSAAAMRAGLAPDVRAAVDELDRKLAEREAAIQASPTLGITAMNGAFWAAAPPAGSTLGITEMYGAFWAPPPPPE